MTVRECYAKIGGDYDEAEGRFKAESMIRRFALKFLDDGSYRDLEAALKAEDTEAAFQAAHTLKGVCQNLSFARLAASSSEVTELLRKGDLKAAASRFDAVAQDYDMTERALKELAAG